MYIYNIFLNKPTDYKHLGCANNEVANDNSKDS